ncbi:hypothetical protein BKA70DRAFT_1571670 [Coprinopsis sp. MPI-PUGE-AT-0042]|nr:hypothetical protein BKA70DRAFT_1571670 [Coprinopsis sp. MPI-PUGE-AT-0042]
MSYTAYARDGGTHSPRLQSNSMTEAGPPTKPTHNSARDPIRDPCAPGMERLGILSLRQQLPTHLLRGERVWGKYRQQIYVWSAVAKFDENRDPLGLSATLLPTFPEEKDRLIARCSLCGARIAYKINDDVFILNWQEISGTNNKGT